MSDEDEPEAQPMHIVCGVSGCPDTRIVNLGYKWAHVGKLPADQMHEPEPTEVKL